MNFTIDLRYQNMYSRLRLLSTESIERILQAKPREICLDTFNYDASHRTYCPLAIALDIPKKCKQENVYPTQEIVRRMVENQAGEAWGTVKGIPGVFYTTNRYEDLMWLCRKILTEREHETKNTN